MFKFPARNDATPRQQKTIHVIKRDGRSEPVSMDKITERLTNLADGLNVDPLQVAIKTVAALYNGVTTEKLDALSAKTAESLKLEHPDYSLLAARIVTSNLHKSTPNKFSECMAKYADAPHFSSVASAFIAKYADELDAMIIPQNDYLFDYFGFKVLENTYMLKVAKQVIDKDGLYYEIGDKRIPNDEIVERPDPKTGKLRLVTIIENREYQVQPKTLDYLMDRPQYMYMRVAIAIYQNQPEPLPLIKECYEHLSNMYYIHATPTLFNSCGAIQQLLSCFLLGTADSIEDIMDNAKRTSLISKSAGGIGIHMNNIRPRGEKIGKSGGKASGLPQQIKIYNELARCWNQGGRRMGSFAIYIEPHHGDIMQFLQMKLQQGVDTERARDLFYAIWCRDLFITRARNDEKWSLFSDRTAPGLSDVYDGMLVCKKCNFCHLADYSNYFDGIRGVECTEAGEEHEFAGFDAYTQLYERYERAGLAIRTLPARKIIDAIVTAQGDNGIPYILHGDTANRQSQQNGLGTIKSSNLCSEIIQWSSDDSYACCTLASINLKRYLEYNDGTWNFNFEKLYDVVRMISRNLDIIIDENSYPVEQCVRNAKDYRPIGIGIQALADVFAILRIPFESDEAEALDMRIMETIYFAALTESMERAKTHGKWLGFEKSPAARGQLRFDLWNYNQEYISRTTGERLELPAQHYDWDTLKCNIKKYGLRNSLSVALMPTASTSQIMGNVESFEPFSFNIYTRSTIAGNFMVSNNYMIKHFIELGIWTPEIKDYLEKDGSVQKMNIPKEIKDIYKTVRECTQSELMRRCSMRQAYVCQSQSMNIHLSENNPETMEGIIYYGWDLGLTTGSYYTHTKAAVDALPTTAVKNVTIKKTASIPVTSLITHPIGDAPEYSPPIQTHLLDKEAPAESNSSTDNKNSSEPLYAGEVCRMEAGCLMCGS